MKNKIYFLAFVLAIIISGCSNSEQETIAENSINSGSSSIGLIDDDRILSAESEPGNWLAYGRTYEEQRFSPLEQINKETIGDLGLVWSKDMGTNRALEATPIVVDGIMFFYKHLEQSLCG
ncbi:hypothetical protein OAP03_00065 [Gammaproteobacteria bacterium]|nr:hypothetical protein [Gammaproteobacteria bacterium]